MSENETQVPPSDDTVIATVVEDATGIDADGNEIQLNAGDEVLVNKDDIVVEGPKSVPPSAELAGCNVVQESEKKKDWVA